MLEFPKWKYMDEDFLKAEERYLSADIEQMYYGNDFSDIVPEYMWSIYKIVKSGGDKLAKDTERKTD